MCICMYTYMHIYIHTYRICCCTWLMHPHTKWRKKVHTYDICTHAMLQPQDLTPSWRKKAEHIHTYNTRTHVMCVHMYSNIYLDVLTFHTRTHIAKLHTHAHIFINVCYTCISHLVDLTLDILHHLCTCAHIKKLHTHSHTSMYVTHAYFTWSIWCLTSHTIYAHVLF